MPRIPDRYGVHILRQFFEAIVERCQEDGLIWGKELYAAATLVEANADRDKMLPRFAVEAHLQQLFGTTYQPPTSAAAHVLPSDTATPAAAGGAETAHHPVVRIGTDLSPERQAKLLEHQQKQYDGMPTMVSPTATSSVATTSARLTYGSA